MLTIFTIIPICIFWLREPELWAILCKTHSISAVYSAITNDVRFTLCHVLLLLLSNPIILVNYRLLAVLMLSTVYSFALLFYAFVCYVVSCLVTLYVSRIAYENLRRYNRGSLFRQSIHVVRRYLFELWEGTVMAPMLVISYIS